MKKKLLNENEIEKQKKKSSISILEKGFQQCILCFENPTMERSFKFRYFLSNAHLEMEILLNRDLFYNFIKKKKEEEITSFIKNVVHWATSSHYIALKDNHIFQMSIFRLQNHWIQFSYVITHNRVPNPSRNRKNKHR